MVYAIIILMLSTVIMLVSIVYAGDITEETYNSMTTTMSELHAASEVQAIFKEWIQDNNKAITKLIQHKSALGDNVPIAWKQTANEMYNKIVTGNTNFTNDYKVFLTGSDGNPDQ